MKKVIGYKFLHADGSSMRGDGRVWYGKKWQNIPGNGAYVGFTWDGITSAGQGELLARVECRHPLKVSTPNGVTCYKRVRVLRWLQPPTAPAWDAYVKAAATAREAYVKATATARDAYVKAKAPAWDAYVKATAPAWDAYVKAKATAWDAYEKATAPARDAYEKATAPARDAYEKAKATAFTRMIKTCKTGNPTTKKEG